MMTRHTLLIIALITLYWGIADANLLQNPGFENGMAPWQTLGGSVQITDWHKSGTYGMKQSGNGDTLMGIKQIAIPVEPNTNYRLWMWASNRGGAGYPNSVRYRMWVDNSLIYEETNGSLNATWVSKNATFNSGSSTLINVSLSCFWKNGPNTMGAVLDDIILAKEDLVPPTMIGAEAFDNEAIIPGIDNEDYVMIRFSEPMNKAKLHYRTGSWINYLDNVLSLNNNHSWLNQDSAAGAIEWNEIGDSLWIYFAQGYPWASVFPSDTIAPNGTTICDEWGNPVTNKVVLSGSFGGDYGHIAGNISPSTFQPIPDSSGIYVKVLETGQNDRSIFGIGDYFIENVVTGTYKLIASRYLFIPETLEITVTPGDTAYLNISLNRFYIAPEFFTDFEAYDGGFCGKIKSAGAGSVWWGTPADSNSYSDVRCWNNTTMGSPVASYIYAPTIDLGAVSSAKLSFYHRYTGAGSFTRSMQTSLDGEIWDTLATYSGESSVFKKDSVDLSVYTGDTIFVRFACEGMFFPNDWRIDDIRLSPAGLGSGNHVEERDDELFLFQNTPNPVDAATTVIGYTIPKGTKVSLRIYDSSGRFVNILVNEIQEPGEHRIFWDCKDSSGKELNSGIYFYCLQAHNNTKVRKLVLCR